MGLLGIKIDMTKACDKMIWELILREMKQLGFRDHFCKLIYACLILVPYSIFLNGSSYGHIVPNRCI